MGNKILNLLTTVFPFLRALGHEDWQEAYEEDEEPELFRHDPNLVVGYYQRSSILDDTPEGLFRTDRMNNWNRGQFGDIELFPNFEELLIRRAFNDELERRIIGG